MKLFPISLLSEISHLQLEKFKGDALFLLSSSHLLILGKRRVNVLGDRVTKSTINREIIGYRQKKRKRILL